MSDPNSMTLDDPTIKRLGELAASIAVSSHMSPQQAMSILVHALGWKLDLDEACAERDAAVARAEQAEQAVARVRELHQKARSGVAYDYCAECEDESPVPWPCDTIRALDGEATHDA